MLQAFGSRQKGLHLQLQFDALPPQEFAPLHLWMAELLAILIVLLVTALMLRVSLIAMGWLLIGHEKLSLSGADCSFRHARDEQHKNRQHQPLMICMTCVPPFRCWCAVMMNKPS
jgi:hypothetical protein